MNTSTENPGDPTGAAEASPAKTSIQLAGWAPWAVIAVIGVVNAAFCFSVKLESDLDRGVTLLALGVLQAEAGLLGVWFSLGTAPAFPRMPKSMLAVYVAWLSWMLGLLRFPLPGQVALFCAAMLFGTAAVSAAAAWLYVKGALKQALHCRWSQQNSSSPEEVRLWIWILASAVANTCAIISLLEFRDRVPAQFYIVGAISAIAAAAISATATVFALSRTPSWRQGVLLAACCLSPVAGGFAFFSVAGSFGQPLWRFWGVIAAYTIGLTVTPIVVLMTMRALGFTLKTQIAAGGPKA